MKRLIIIKYGEMTTKKDNIGLFLKKLKDNVEFSLAQENVTINYDSGRMFINCKNNNFDSVLNRLKKVFGIHEIIIGYEIESTDLEFITQN